MEKITIYTNAPLSQREKIINSLNIKGFEVDIKPVEDITRKPETFEIKTYGFKELASMYFPSISPESAADRLRAWIDKKPEYRQQSKTRSLLIKEGYKRQQKILTPKQVKIIIDEFGEPF